MRKPSSFKSLLTAGLLLIGVVHGPYSMPAAIEAPGVPRPKGYEVQGEGIDV